jgi:hypothetical protein
MPALQGEEVPKLDRHRLVGMSGLVADAATVGGFSVELQGIRARGGARKFVLANLDARAVFLPMRSLLFRRDTASAPAPAQAAAEDQQQEPLLKGKRS